MDNKTPQLNDWASGHSPKSPETPTECKQFPQYNYAFDPNGTPCSHVHAIKVEKPENVLHSKGFCAVSKFADTLQGSIYRARMKTERSYQNVVIKVTNKDLHQKSMSIKNGFAIPVKENIEHEIQILSWLTEHNSPPSMTRFIKCFEDDQHIYLVMEDGGISLFEFTSECHKMISLGWLSLSEWQSAVQTLFKQMVEFVHWMHTEMNICHLDISLENMLISDVFVLPKHSPNGAVKVHFNPNMKIKFCDFGLATMFNGTDFRCHKYVGKAGYQAPKVHEAKLLFDARAADIWSLGVVLFMLTVGSAPFHRPVRNEAGFSLIADGNLVHLLISGGRLSYLNKHIFNLLPRMLNVDEEKRITIDDILSEPWLK